MNITVQLDSSQTAAYLRTLPAIRDRCSKVHDLAVHGKLDHFDYHPEKEDAVADFCIDIIKRDYGENLSAINPHGRWRHLDAGNDRMAPLFAKWASDAATAPDSHEVARRTIDLIVISVLLDAGAGNKWMYTEPRTDLVFTRSEGLGVASFHMFDAGLFSSDPSQPHRVDAIGLSAITVEKVASAMQVSDANPMIGIEGRSHLLLSLSKALQAAPEFFGKDGRPGNVVDFLEKQAKVDGEGQTSVPLAALWHALVEGLNPIWPSRLTLGGITLGDVWPCPSLVKMQLPQKEGDNLVPFHKLTQWLTYSLIEALQKILGWKLDGIEDMTGLPEYRNGGLLVDLGVLTLKPSALPVNPATNLPYGQAQHPAIVEWRAMTVIELDRIANIIRNKLGVCLSLPQILESATWKGGREIAKLKRPETGGPPIEIESDGTVF